MKALWLLVVSIGLCGCVANMSQSNSQAGSGDGDAAANRDSGQFRASPPTPGPNPELRAPLAKRVVLENGLTVLVVPRSGLGLVQTQVVVRAGSYLDPQQLPGVAGFLAEVLKAGTKTRSAKKLAADIEDRGASLHSSVSADSLGFGIMSRREHAESLMAILAEVVRAPAFAADEIERVRKRRLAALEQSLDSPKSVANRVFRAQVYGADHPYGHSTLGSRAALGQIAASSLREFYAQHITPSGTAVIVVGDVLVDDAVAMVRRGFGDWVATASLPPTPQLAPASNPPEPAAITSNGLRVVLVDKPGAPQSQLRLGHRGLARSHQDYYPALIGNAVFGGMFGSRINMNLREDKGYTYGARSSFEFLRRGGRFGIFTAVRTGVTKESIVELLSELRRLREAGITAQEFTVARNRYGLSVPGFFQTISSVAAMYSNIFVNDLSLDYYQHLQAELEAVDQKAVAAAIDAHIRASELVIVVVGDRERIEQDLVQLNLGEIYLHDAAGKKL